MIKNTIITLLIAIIATISIKVGAEYIYVPDKKFTQYIESFNFNPQWNRIDINKYEDNNAICYITVNQTNVYAGGASTSQAISCLKKIN